MYIAQSTSDLSADLSYDWRCKGSVICIGRWNFWNKILKLMLNQLCIPAVQSSLKNIVLYGQNFSINQLKNIYSIGIFLIFNLQVNLQFKKKYYNFSNVLTDLSPDSSYDWKCRRSADISYEQFMAFKFQQVKKEW